ncbi:MAG TPA: SDR family NAD(P)-dependent oxidoreductase [bacterium]
MEGAERWKGKVALVTGATTGIGEAIAHGLGGLGMKVAVAGRRKERLEAVVKALQAEGAQGLATPVDLRSEGDIQRMFQSVHDTWGTLDILVNNAGLGFNGTIGGAPTADWKEVLDVNILAFSICIREALKDMTDKQDAAIINISSLAGHRVPPGNRGTTFYAASKHAVRAITEGLRAELVANKSKIKLGMISPGMVATEFHARSTRSDKKPANFAQFRTLDPEDVAQAALYMISTPRHVQIHDIVMRSVEQPH